MIGMQKVIGSWICTERFTPVMVDAEKAAFKNDRKSVWSMHRNYIHNPNLLRY